MNRTHAFATAFTLSLLAPLAQAACTLEAEPAIPDGAKATLDQMKAAQASVKTYGEAYRSCLDAANAEVPADETAEAKAAREQAYTAAYNASIDRQEALAAKFNESVKAYKAAQPPATN